MKLQFIKELIRNNNTILFPQNTYTNTNCYSCVCSQCKEKWSRATESLGAYTFPVTDGLVTAKGHLLHTAGHPQHYSQKLKRQPSLPPNTQLLKKFPGTWCCCRCPRTSPTSPFTCWALSRWPSWEPSTFTGCPHLPTPMSVPSCTPGRDSPPF